MKHLIDYSGAPKEYFTTSDVSSCIARAMKEEVKEILMDDDEYESFISAYDSILPFDWDGFTFRGMKIKRT